MPLFPFRSFWFFSLLGLSGLGACSAGTDRGAFASADAAYTVEKSGEFGERARQSAGLEMARPHHDLWTHADGGNTAYLYRVTQQGDVLEALNLAPLQNIDWEDMAQDDEQRLYVGDFGNNQNKRRNLRVLRISGPGWKTVDTIRFSYPDQHRFPPPKSRRSFDCEAFYCYQDSLYLFSRNRGPSNYLKLYVLPAQPGRHRARLADSLALPTPITAADISPDGRRVALLSTDCVYLFGRLPGRRLFDSQKSRLTLSKVSKPEALVYLNDHDFMFSDSKGKLFRATYHRPAGQ